MNRLLIVLGLFITILPTYIFGQSPASRQEISRLAASGNADTATVMFLKRQCELYMDRPGTDSADVRMATFIASQIESLAIRKANQEALGVARLLYAKIYRQTGDQSRGKLASGEAVRLLSANGPSRLYAESLIELGGTFNNAKTDLPEKIRLYQQGIAIFSRFGDKREVAGLKEFLGDLLAIHREYDRAIRVLHEALKLYQEVGYVRLHGVYSLLGDAYLGANNFVESLRYSLLAVETGERLKEDGPLMMTIINRLGLNYYSVRYFDEAIGCFSKSVQLAQATADTSSVVFLRLNIADALYQAGRYQQSLDTLAIIAPMINPIDKSSVAHLPIIAIRNYVVLGQLDDAEKYYTQLQDLYAREDVTESIRQAIALHISAYLQARGHFTATRPYLDMFYRTQHSTTASLIKRIEAARLQYRTDSAIGNMRAALSSYQLFTGLSDSLAGMTQTRQMGLLQLQFETRHKDERIQLLTQKNQAQEAVIHKGDIIRNVIIGSAGLLIIIIGLLYNRFRLKKRSHLQLVHKQAEINDQNAQLMKLIDEREWLLREIHHRVKNNLQIVISLLNTQSQYLDSQDAIAAIQNSQHRMHAMSLIHQRLYQTDDLGSIDMKWYISELMGYMKDSFDTKGRILFREDCDRVLMDVVQAVPLGLILNEAISNAMKYAFPGGREGTVSVVFKQEAGGWCRLQITDDGVGFKADDQHTQSLGMSLMYGLAGQLEGDIAISNQTGVSVMVRFRRSTVDLPQE